MTKAELLELSLRARIYLAGLTRPNPFRSNRGPVYLGDYRIWTMNKSMMLINRGAEPFFDHIETVMGVEDPSKVSCTNDEWASDLLLKLRGAQILNTLAKI